MADIEKFAEQLRRFMPVKRNAGSKRHERQSFIKNCYKKLENTKDISPV